MEIKNYFNIDKLNHILLNELDFVSKEETKNIVILCFGQKFFDFMVILLISLFKNSNIKDFRVLIYTDQDTFNKNEYVFLKLIDFDFNIIVTAPDDYGFLLKNGHGFYKFYPIISGYISEDTIFIDCDSILNSNINLFDLTDELDEYDIIFSDLNIIEVNTQLPNRLISGRYPNDFVFYDLMKNIYSEKLNVSFFDFCDILLFHPKVSWKNCGIYSLSKRIINDDKFVGLCNCFICNEVSTGSDELLYYIYSNFINNNVSSFSSLGIKVYQSLNSDMDNNGLIHLFLSNGDFSLGKYCEIIYSLGYNDLIELTQYSNKIEMKEGDHYSFILNSENCNKYIDGKVSLEINNNIIYLTIFDGLLFLNIKNNKSKHKVFIGSNFDDFLIYVYILKNHNHLLIVNKDIVMNFIYSKICLKDL